MNMRKYEQKKKKQYEIKIVGIQNPQQVKIGKEGYIKQNRICSPNE